jgi:hypothetical protein
MSLYKWTLEVCTTHTTEDEEIPNHILDVLTEDSESPYFKSGFIKISAQEARDEFGVPEDHIRDYYETCVMCDRDIDDDHEENPTDAMYELFDKYDIDTTGFVYCSDMCRVQHLIYWSPKLRAEIPKGR